MAGIVYCQKQGKSNLLREKNISFSLFKEVNWIKFLNTLKFTK